MKPSHWQHLHCHCLKSSQETISHYFETENALSITWQDAGNTPILEPLPGETPFWDKLVITALFNSDADLSDVLATLEKNRSQWRIQNIQTERLEDKVWERAWMEDFHPMQFGENLWIYPSSYELPDDDSTKIRLDPGLAFGTGTHPTTALCLEWLDAHPPHGLSVIDYGCGSGLLAIAAVKLGAQQVLATDIDEQALISTQDNRHKNKLSEESITTYFPDQLPKKPVDLLIANILSGPLVELSTTFSQLIKAGGSLILSGIIEQQTDTIIAAYQTHFEDISIAKKEDWIRITARRKT
ncbi:MAG: 50S ribosomal protein L11 methyltransferase [Cocleimonas sp.]|nr:50S ribosomal protein L11 methyltransferase [Cocleimonas sp.]